MQEFTLKTEYIELVKLVKLLGFADTGGHAKLMIEDGLISVNGTCEHQKRKKIRRGDTVTISGDQVKIL